MEGEWFSRYKPDFTRVPAIGEEPASLLRDMSTNQTELQENTTDALQDLLTRAYDAEQGFQQAAECVESAQLASLFNEYSAQRREFGGQIKGLMRALHGEPDKGASIKGKVHQLWIDIRSKISDGCEQDVLDECLRGEEKAIEDYQDYLNDSSLHPEAHTLISKQLGEIRDIFGRLKHLERVEDRKSA